MATLRELIDGSKVVRAAAMMLGVGSLLGLLLTVTLWAFAYRDAAVLSGCYGEKHAYSLHAWQGQVACVAFKLNNPILRFAWLRGMRVESIKLSPEEAARSAKENEDQRFRASLFASDDAPIDVRFPLWAACLAFLTGLAAALALSFRFTARTVLAASAPYGAVLGWMTAIYLRT
ncbi:hypothetical protein [Lacipirellula sp.]|uniref:hypothetical protein n=1 Tax=Lacipirellula sp. TaxID=2691419 RepID=UPI003D0A2F87